MSGRNNGLGYYFVGYDLFLNAGPTGIYLRFETKDGGFFWKEEIHIYSKTTPRKLQGKLWSAILNVITGGSLSGPTSPLSLKQVLGNLGLDEDSDSNKPKNDKQTDRMVKNTNWGMKALSGIGGKIADVRIDPKMFSANTLNYDHSFFSFYNRFVLPLFKIQAIYSNNLLNNIIKKKVK